MRLLCKCSLLLILLVSLGSCQFAKEREAHRSQALLDEADLLLKTREFGKAKALADEALSKLKPLIKEQPKHLDFQLLEVRAYLMQFVSQNVLVMEQAPVRSRSLVRLPKLQDYVAFDETIPPAERRLNSLVDRSEELSVEQRAFVHGMRAAVYRLQESTLDSANKEYEKAIAEYRSLLREAEKDRGANKNKIEQYESQIRGLRLAQVEVSLLAENWARALEQLHIAAAGPDLKYFAVHFELLETNIERIEQKLESEQARKQGSREDKLRQAIEAKKQKRYSTREKIGGYNPYKVALIKNQIELENTQNNLIYRIICYHNLGEKDNLDSAQAILREQYPSISTELESKLRQYR